MVVTGGQRKFGGSKVKGKNKEILEKENKGKNVMRQSGGLEGKENGAQKRKERWTMNLWSYVISLKHFPQSVGAGASEEETAFPTPQNDDKNP